MATTVRHLIAGPPGTGKTTRCLGIVDQELAAGTAIDQIAYVTFGRSAADDVRQRVIAQWGSLADSSEIAFRGFKTIHALAYGLLGLRRESVMGAAHWGAFGKQHGYNFTRGPSIDEGFVGGPTRTPHDRMRAVYDLGRNLQIDAATAVARAPFRINAFELARFVDRYEAYKKQHGLLDFVDMLEMVLQRGLRPHFTVAIVDEAQDLSPLQVAVIAAWFRHCERLYVAGDDDQALYEFQGSNAAWMRDYATTATMEVLGQSWRVPRAAHRVAMSIIRRNRHRIPKDYRPRDASGSVEVASLDEALRLLTPVGTSSFVLARNRCFLNEVATRLRQLGVPFVLEGGPSPFDPQRGIAKALRAGMTIAGGMPIAVGDLAALLDHVPSRGASLIPLGLKTEVARLPSCDVLAPADLMRLLQGGALLEVIATHGPAEVMLGADQQDVNYVRSVFAKYGAAVEPSIRLTTVHGAKGREADTVLVLPDMTRATYEAMQNGGEEAENRVAYVAATRTRRHLVLVQPRTRWTFLYPSAPVGAVVTGAIDRRDAGAPDETGPAAAFRVGSTVSHRRFSSDRGRSRGSNPTHPTQQLRRTPHDQLVSRTGRVRT